MAKTNELFFYYYLIQLINKVTQSVNKFKNLRKLDKYF